MKRTTSLDCRLQEQLLVGRRIGDDRLMLADAVMQAALDGSRVLTANERVALEASPLTLRRFRQLAIERRSVSRPANDAWHGSEGMLRAADGGTLARLCTDDGYWRLHFVGGPGGWRVILQLVASAPFSGHLLATRPALCVTDGAGEVVLQGRLDADGECEASWPFDLPPAQHFQQRGAIFAVRPAQPA
jgi:hypothetical protein